MAVRLGTYLPQPTSRRLPGDAAIGRLSGIDEIERSRLRRTGSAHHCRYHAGHSSKDCKRSDLCDLPQTSLLRYLHGRHLLCRLVLVIDAESADNDVATERGEEWQCGTQQCWAQPVDLNKRVPTATDACYCQSLIGGCRRKSMPEYPVESDRCRCHGGRASPRIPALGQKNRDATSTYRPSSA